jgi:hypothetical protein
LNVTTNSHKAELDMQEAELNRSECAIIAEDTRELIEGIIRSLEGLTEADINVHLNEDIKTFGK